MIFIFVTIRENLMSLVLLSLMTIKLVFRSFHLLGQMVRALLLLKLSVVVVMRVFVAHVGAGHDGGPIVMVTVFTSAGTPVIYTVCSKYAHFWCS